MSKLVKPLFAGIAFFALVLACGDQDQRADGLADNGAAGDGGVDRDTAGDEMDGGADQDDGALDGDDAEDDSSRVDVDDNEDGDLGGDFHDRQDTDADALTDVADEPGELDLAADADAPPDADADAPPDADADAPPDADADGGGTVCPNPDPPDDMASDRDPSLDIVCVTTGIDSMGRPWVRVTFAGAWLPPAFFSWFSTVRLLDEGFGTLGTYTRQRHDGEESQFPGEGLTEDDVESFTEEAMGYLLVLNASLADTIAHVQILSGMLRTEEALFSTDLTPALPFDSTVRDP